MQLALTLVSVAVAVTLAASLVWAVGRRRAPVEPVSAESSAEWEGKRLATVGGEEASLSLRDTLLSRTGLFVWMGDAPDDAASSVGHRMRTPMNLLMVWSFGGAVSRGRDGAFDIYGAQLLDGRRI